MRIPKTWATVSLLLAFAGATWLDPALSAFRPPSPGRILDALTASWRGNPLERLFPESGAEATATAARPAPSPDNLAVPPPVPVPSEADGGWPSGADEDAWAARAAGAVGIEDYGDVLPRFYDALARTGRKEPGAVTRISHFGDSPVTGDLLAGDARSRLQARFGDAGHGWILADRPWGWYSHRGVELSGAGWTIRTATDPSARGGAFGLGGAAFTAPGGTVARSRISTGKDGRGHPFGRFEIHYQPLREGGTVSISVDGSPAAEFGTASGDGARPAVRSFPVPDAPHGIGLRAKGDGPVRLYGIVLERDVPGVVYDSLGANAATIRRLARVDRAGWIASLAARRPDLVILNYGTNESSDDWLAFPAYAKDYREVIGRVREALPGAAILLMAPMDRGVRTPDGGIGTPAAIPRLVAAQRFVAREERVAFFDTYAAMGGKGTMADWHGRTPRRVAGDYTHPTQPGARIVGDLLVDALLKGYATRQETETVD